MNIFKKFIYMVAITIIVSLCAISISADPYSNDNEENLEVSNIISTIKDEVKFSEYFRIISTEKPYMIKDLFPKFANGVHIQHPHKKELRHVLVYSYKTLFKNNSLVHHIKFKLKTAKQNIRTYSPEETDTIINPNYINAVNDMINYTYICDALLNSLHNNAWKGNNILLICVYKPTQSKLCCLDKISTMKNYGAYTGFHSTSRFYESEMPSKQKAYLFSVLYKQLFNIILKYSAVSLTPIASVETPNIPIQDPTLLDSSTLLDCSSIFTPIQDSVFTSNQFGQDFIACSYCYSSDD